MSEKKPRWEIVLTHQAEKTLYRLSKNLLQPIDQALLALTEDPRPLESHPLPGHDNRYRLPVAEWRVTYAVEDERLLVLILEIAPKQQPERYRLEEEPDKDFSPGPPAPPDQTVVPPIIELRPQPLSGLEGDFLYRAPGLLKRLRKEKIRLLIGDHNQESRENLRQQLFGESDIEIVGMAATGEEAIQTAVEQQPDIVLLETHLPGIDGFPACEKIVQQVPAAQIIMMSVWGTEEYVRRAMLAGAKEFLIKPFSGLELAVSIRRVYRSAAWQRLADTRTASYLLDTFDDLKERLRARLMAELEPRMDASRPEEVRQLIQDRFDQILAQENIILSRSERKRLFEAVVAEIQLRLTKSEQQPTQPYGEAAVDLDEAQIKAESLWFKLYKLGNRAEISLSVANLAESLRFYHKLGLDRMDGGEEPYPWAVISDGRLHLGLYQQVFSSPTLSYFYLNATLEERLSHLAKLGIRLDDIQVPGLKLVTAEFESPEGQHVILADIWGGMKTAPAGKKFFSRYGTFSELGLTTKDVKAAVAYWEQLGFECVTEGDRPYPWAVVSDGLIRLGFHQTTKLTQPTITYFTPDMPDRLKRLRQKGIKFKAEQKDKKGRRIGAVIESPDGQLFFFFTGEAKAQSSERNTSKGKNEQEVDIHGNLPQHEGAQWYLIYSYSGNELKMQQNLLQRIEAMGLQDKIFQVVVPPDSSVPLWISGSSLVSGSLLVEMVMDEDSWYAVKNTPGVTGFVGAKNRPTPLPFAEVDKLLKHPQVENSQANGSFKIGQKVRIIEGPFEDFMGTVDEVDQEQARVKVQISFFGQEKLIEFDFVQVEHA